MEEGEVDAKEINNLLHKEKIDEVNNKCQQEEVLVNQSIIESVHFMVSRGGITVSKASTLLNDLKQQQLNLENYISKLDMIEVIAFETRKYRKQVIVNIQGMLSELDEIEKYLDHFVKLPKVLAKI